MDCSYEADGENVLGRLERIEALVSEYPNVMTRKEEDAAAPHAPSTHPAAGAAGAALPDAAQMDSLLVRNVHQLLLSAGDGLTLEQIGDRYFETIHRWFPIISQCQYDRIVAEEKGDGSPSSFALLAMCMFLATQRPTAAEVYQTCKTQFSLFTALRAPDVRFVQAGILVALFEYAQGLLDQAHITLGICARTAYVCGLHEPRGTEEAVDDDENAQTWWGIIVLDKYISTATTHLHFPLPAILNPPGNAVPSRATATEINRTTHTAPLSGPDAFRAEVDAVQSMQKVQDFIQAGRGASNADLRGAIDIDLGLTALLCRMQQQSESDPPAAFAAVCGTAHWHVFNSAFPPPCCSMLILDPQVPCSSSTLSVCRRPRQAAISPIVRFPP